MVQQSTSNDHDGYGVKAASNGGQHLTDLFFTGEKYDLQIEQGSHSSQAGTVGSSGMMH